MFGSPKAHIEPTRYEQHSSTPLAENVSSPGGKIQSYKQFNHSRLRQHCSPYSTTTSQHHIQTSTAAVVANSGMFYNIQQQNLQINQTSVPNSPNGYFGSSSSSGINYQTRGQQRDLEVHYSETSSPLSGRQMLMLNDSTSDTSGNNNNEHSINVSLRTNPPTTPVSASVSGSLNESPASSMLCTLLKKQDLKSTTTTTTTNTSSSVSSASHMPPPASTRPLHPTPATTTSPSNGTSSSVSSSNLNQQVISSMQTTYSRSSSVASLSSYADCFKTNSHQSSDVQSEYTPAGFMTPGCYSDLPDSPTEPQSTMLSKFYANKLMQQQQEQHMYMLQQQQAQQQSANSSMRFNYSHQPTPDETYYVTADSSASKSNDITVMERTFQGTNSNYNSLSRSHGHHHHQQQQQHQQLSAFQLSGNSSSESSQSNSFMVNHHPTAIIPKSTNYSTTSGVVSGPGCFAESGVDGDDEEVAGGGGEDADGDGSVRRYCINEDDAEMWSDTRSVRSNVSALTFPNEPAVVDVNLMRNLLASSSSLTKQRAAPLTAATTCLPFMSTIDPRNVSGGQQESTFVSAKKPAWATSNYTPLSQSSAQNSFTPPVKLQASNDGTAAFSSMNFPNPFQVNRSLNFTGRQNEADLTRSHEIANLANADTLSKNCADDNFNGDQDYETNSLRAYADERDETQSVTCSIPSIIKNDLEATALNMTAAGDQTVNEFSELLNRMNSSRYDPINESSSSLNWTLMQPKQQPIIAQLQHQVSLNNSPFNRDAAYMQPNPSKRMRTEDELSYSHFSKKINCEEEEEEEAVSMNDQSMNNENSECNESDVQQVLSEFIEDFYNQPSGNMSNGDVCEESQNEVFDEVDGDDGQLGSVCGANRVVLPKIDEADEEEEPASSRQNNELYKKKANSRPAPVIQMTKTALLRANKLREMKTASAANCANKPTRPVPSLTSSHAPAGHRIVKENSVGSNDASKKPISVNSQHKKPTIISSGSSNRLSNISVLTAINMHASKFNKN